MMVAVTEGAALSAENWCCAIWRESMKCVCCRHRPVDEVGLPNMVDTYCGNLAWEIENPQSAYSIRRIQQELGYADPDPMEKGLRQLVTEWKQTV